MPFRLQYITLLHFINMHAKFQFPISITVDFMSEGDFEPILDPRAPDRGPLCVNALGPL